MSELQQYIVYTSDLPRRSMLEMSYTPPSAAVSTPPVPRFCSRNISNISPKRGCWKRRGSWVGCQTCSQTVWIQRESSYMTDNTPLLKRLGGCREGKNKGLPVGTYLTQMWYSDVHSSSQSCAKVGGAGENVPQVLIPHKFMAVRLNQSLHLHTHISQMHGVMSSQNPTSLSPLQNRVNTSCMLPPFCMEITLVWSSSLTQTRKVLRWLCQMPRASGQSRAIPEASSRGDTGLSNRK